jgi:hypothetical protein
MSNSRSHLLWMCIVFVWFVWDTNCPNSFTRASFVKLWTGSVRTTTRASWWCEPQDEGISAPLLAHGSSPTVWLGWAQKDCCMWTNKRSVNPTMKPQMHILKKIDHTSCCRSQKSTISSCYLPPLQIIW